MNKTMIISVIVGIAAMMVLSVLPAMAAQQGGVIKDLHPPMNDGTHQGVGIITGIDGKTYVFQTPSDNDGKVLSKGNAVIFDVTNGRHVTNVEFTIVCTPTPICTDPFPP